MIHSVEIPEFFYHFDFYVKSVLTGPTTSETWDTLVPDAAPKYKTLLPGGMWILSTPPKTAAANLDLKGFQTRYSIFPVK